MKPTRNGLLLLRLIRPAIHAVLILAVFYWMIHVRRVTDLIPFVQLRIPPIDVSETLLFAVISALIFLGIAIVLGLYELFKPVHAYYRKFLKTRGLWVIVSSFAAYMGFGYVFVNGISRFVLLAGAVVVLVAVTCIDLMINVWQSSLETRTPYRIQVMSSNTSLAHKIMSTFSLYSIYEVFETHISDAIHDSVDIILAAGPVDKKRLQHIGDQARIQGQSFYHVGDGSFLEDLISSPERLGPLIALEYKAGPLDGRWRVVKRTLDICCSFVGLLVLSPLLLVVAILIKIDSAGPVLYMQERVGKSKLPFRFIKFRSMYTHLSVGEKYGGKKAEKLYDDLIASDKNVRAGVLNKIEDDPRITRVGRFLRKTSLDELPSLRSVLVGDMSLIGPRPHMPSEVDQYDPRQERLFSIKPGITGYAQIFGRDKLPFDEEAKLDLYYIQNRSLFLDAYVLVSTLRVLFSGK